MKKTLTKALSVFLSALMLFTTSAVFGFATDSEIAVPTISIEKVSETKTEVVIAVKLESNSFSSLDLTLTAADDLTLIQIEAGEQFNALVSNTANGKISFASTTAVSAPADIAEYTYTKATADGVTVADFTVTIEACYVEADDVGEDVFASVTLNNQIPAVHTHVASGDWYVTTPATCGAEGSQVRYCSECGELAETETIAATGDHKNTATEHLDATCTEDGYTKVICTDCNQCINTISIPATGHVDTHTETINATCTEDGVVKVICSCGEVVVEEKIPATGHVDTHTEKIDATCTTDGVIKTICACGEIVSEEIIPATGHIDTYKDVKLPTCTEDGYDNKVCSACGTIIESAVLESIGHSTITDYQPATCTENGHLRIFCTVCQDIQASTTLKAEGHNWLDWEVIKEPTYAANGVERRLCKKCGADEERDIAKLVAKPTELLLSMNEFSMNYKQTARLFATINPEEAAYSTEVIWESSNEKVATVNEYGEVLAVGVGTATITARSADGTVEDTCEITVSYSFLQWIIVYLLFGWIWYL